VATPLPPGRRHGAERRLSGWKEEAMETAVTMLALALLVTVLDRWRE
jgi:hypothetical protein